MLDPVLVPAFKVAQKSPNASLIYLYSANKTDFLLFMEIWGLFFAKKTFFELAKRVNWVYSGVATAFLYRIVVSLFLIIVDK